MQVKNKGYSMKTTKIVWSLLLGVGIVYANALSFDKTLSLKGITFHVTTTGEGSLRQLSIVP